MKSDFRIKIKEVNMRKAIVDVQGDVDLFRATEFEETINELIVRGWHNLIINLKNVIFIDSSGIGVLIGANIKIKKNRGSLIIVSKIKNSFMKTLTILNLVDEFNICETVEEALQLMTEESLRPAV